MQKLGVEQRGVRRPQRTKQSLIRYLLLGALATAAGERTEPETAQVHGIIEREPTDEERTNQRLWMFFDNFEGENPRSLDLARQYLGLEPDQVVASPENVPLLRKRSVELFQGFHTFEQRRLNRQIETFILSRIVVFPELPSQLSNEAMIHKALRSVRHIAEQCKSSDDADFIYEAFNAKAQRYLHDALTDAFPFQVKDTAELKHIAQIPNFQMYVVDIDFSPVLKPITKKGLPEFLDLVDSIGNSAVGKAFFEQVTFDSADFPTVITDTNIRTVIEQTHELIELQNESGNIYGLSNAGDIYAKSCTWAKPFVARPEEAEQLVKRLAQIHEIELPYNSAAPVAEAFIFSIQPEGFPTELQPKTIQEYLEWSATLEGLLRKTDIAVEFQRRYTTEIVEQVSKQFRRELYGDRITAKEMREVNQRLQSIFLNMPREYGELGALQRIYLPENGAFSGRFDFAALDDTPRDANVLGISEFLDDRGQVGRMLLVQLFKNHDFIRFVDRPSVITARSLPEYIEFSRAARGSRDGLAFYDQSLFFMRYIKDMSLSEDRWLHPDSWRDVESLQQAFERASEHVYGEFVSQIDLRNVPLIHLEFGKTSPQLDRFQASPLQERAFERLDFTDLPRKIEPRSIQDIVDERSVLISHYGTLIGELYLSQLDYSAFPERITEENIEAVAEAIMFLVNSGGKNLADHYTQRLRFRGTLQGTLAPVITNENIERECAKALLKDHQLYYYPLRRDPEIQVTFSAPNNFEELLNAQRKLELLQQINPEQASALAEEYYLLVDWSKVTAGIDATDVVAVERLRQQVNSAVSSTTGDSFLIHLGINQIERHTVTLENLPKRVDFAVAYLTIQTADLNQDVLGMYHMLGNFQVTKILEFLLAENIAVTDSRVQPSITALQEAGADIPIEDGKIAKLLRSWKNPTYIMQKGLNELSTSDALRPEWRNTELSWKTEADVRLASGFELRDLYNRQQKVARVVIGHQNSSAKVDYMIQVGGGLTEDVVQEKFKKSLVAEAVGSYTTGASKPAELSINNGKVENFLISDRDGILIITPDGRMSIHHRDRLTLGDVDGSDSREPLQFAKRLDHFKRFIDRAKKRKLDVMMSHLLIADAQIAVAQNSSASVDKRRVVGLFADGRFGLFDFTPTLTLYEAATLLQRAGVVAAMNCDTGYYDHANVHTVTGKRIELGEQDQDGTNNKLVFYSKP